MHYVKQLTESRHRLRLLAFIGLIILSACNSAAIPEPHTSASSDFTRIATLTIDAATSKADLASYNGEIISFQPEAGFAVLGFTKLTDELSTLSTTANQGTFSSPAVAAGSKTWSNGASAWSNGASAWSNGASAWANGHSAWSNGFSAWSNGASAWANGHSAWSNGASAWANGHSAWANGLPAASSVGDNLHAFDAINLTQGQLRAPKLGEGVVVAVIDTGIALEHPGLENSLTPLDTWYDFIGNDTYPGENTWGSNAAMGHATAVAGLVLQVAPAAKIMPLRVLESNGVGDTDDIVRAIDWAVSKGADVINISVGANQPDPAIHAMLKYAGSKGVFTVASAGNDGKNTLSYPAFWGTDSDGSYVGEYLLSVGSQDKSGKPSKFSNFGDRNEIWAPGEDLFSIYSNLISGGDMSAKVSGTSFATPLVAGTLALALAENPNVSYRGQFHDQLKLSVKATGGALDIDGYLQRLGLNAPSPARSALFVVGNGNQPASVDTFLARRLEALGFAVSLQEDSTVAASQASGKDLVLVSNTVYSPHVADKFKHVNVPVIVWEAFIFDDMGMSTSGSAIIGSSANLSGNFLVGGLTGQTKLYTSSQHVGYGYPTADAQILGRLIGYNVASIFAYHRGDTMYGLQAPAKRVALPFSLDSSAVSSAFSPDAAALFDVLVVWAVSDQ